MSGTNWALYVVLIVYGLSIILNGLAGIRRQRTIDTHRDILRDLLSQLRDLPLDAGARFKLLERIHYMEYKLR